MSDSVSEKTRKISSIYFKGFTGDKPYDLWKSFDKELGKKFSLFITGNLYSREIISHKVRQLVTISALTVLGRENELKLHIHAAINVGCSPREISEVIFQTFTYAGIPTVNGALKVLMIILKERDLWPIT